MEYGIIVDHNGYERFGDDKYKKLRQHGFTCADYNMSNLLAGIYVLDDDSATKMMLNEKKLSKEAGVKISQVHGPWDVRFMEKTEEGLEKLLMHYKRSIRFSGMLGCKRWVIHPLLPCGGDEIGTPDAQKTWDVNLKFFSELVKTAKEYDVIICLENMPFLNYSMSKPQVILDFVNTINDDNFRICLDTGHVATFKELSVGDEIRRVKDKIETLHIHDTIYEKDVHLFPYQGVIDWQDFARALRDIGYQGVFSLETQPFRKLSDELFDEVGITLNKIAKSVMEDIH